MEEERKTTEDKIKEVEAKILSNSKDAHFAKNLIQQLAGLYQMDKEIDISINDVTDTIDLGACAVKKCKQGYIFEAKGGMQTFVSWRMARVCAMLETLFDLHVKADEDNKEMLSAYTQAVEMVLQCPIFSSLDERALFQNATNILSTFNEYCNEHYTNAEVATESEQQIRDNIEFEKIGEALEQMVDAPLPPED